MKKRDFVFGLFMLLWGISYTAMAQTVTFFTPRTVRVLRCTDDSLRKSVVVTAVPTDVKVKTHTANGITYSSKDLTVEVNHGKVTFYNKWGERLCTEGETRFTAIEEGPDKGAYKVKQTFAIEAEEGIYGIGLLQNGKMSHRAENRKMQQNNLEDYAHFFQSIKGYGVYWDNYSPTQIIVPNEGEAGELVLESQVGKASDYYFIYGTDADGVIAEMRHLTGKVPMLPLWTYGFHQSRERYKSQDELLEVVRKYRDMGIPFDGIIQDWQYWGGNYTWNAMEFINENFGQAQRMIDEVHKRNAHISISVWSSFGPETKPFKQLKERDLLMDFKTWPESGLNFWPPRKDYPSGVRCYDVYSEEARRIYWQHLSRLHGMGIDAWWMDSTDPDHVAYRESDLDEITAMGSWRSVRNLFPYMAVSGVYNNQRAVDSTKRVFILTRSYFAGQQRYGANTWSGDIASSWQNFRKQVPICLSYTLTANPNVNTDIGGFFAGSYNTQGENSATRNPQYQELYVRWMQFGAFTPMMRSHGTGVYREIYHYGKPGEPVYDALVDAIKLRYSLLPYTYSLSWQVSQADKSFMRALFMDFKADSLTWNNGSEFMYGPSLLVCPVLHPLYTQERIIRANEYSGWDKNEATGELYAPVDWDAPKQYEVYLPKGTEWYDYHTNERYNGGQKVSAAAPLAYSPLYVKAGSIIPVSRDVQYASVEAWDTLTIRVYPGADAEFVLYEDEGDGYNYEKGLYSTITFRWDDKAQGLTIGRRIGQFPGMKKHRQFRIEFIDGTSKVVAYDGHKTTIKNR
ncbi:MAG: DUF5110 domain-containing protein [Bacteroidaceae bacterium]|nr:DUF5110 domain-containing protein [Bacteroidaceae bacterium]